jgi:hypothetical protein
MPWASLISATAIAFAWKSTMRLALCVRFVVSLKRLTYIQVPVSGQRLTHNADKAVMANIKLRIVGRGADTDAPIVDDLLDQIRDCFDILRGVEEALAEDGRAEVQWRMVNASKNTPLFFEAAPFGRQYGMNVDRRATRVVRATAVGLRQLQTRERRPDYFSEKVLAKAEHLFERVTKGLAQTTIEYGDGLPELALTPASAYAAAAYVRKILEPISKTFDEIGSVEGIAHGPDLDGWGNRIVKIRVRMTGDDLTCRLFDQALKAVEDRHVGDLWKDCRVEAHGIIHYKALGVPSRIDATTIRFLRPSSELPNVEDILDEEFTGGMTTEDYLTALRDGELN